MNEVNGKFYVLFNVDNSMFAFGYDNGHCRYASQAHHAKEYRSIESAEAARNLYKEKDRLVVKEIHVVVCDIP